MGTLAHVLSTSFRYLGDVIDDAVSPARCVICGALGDWLCTVCRPVAWPARCERIETTQGLLPLISQAGFDNEAVRRCILLGKEQGIHALWDVMGRELAPHCMRQWGMPVLVPIPSAASHVRKRGFSHTQLLAKSLAREAGWSWSDILTREDGATLRGLSRSEREQTSVRMGMRGTVALPVALADDVYTTGRTMEAAVERLTKAGVMVAGCATLARAE